MSASQKTQPSTPETKSLNRRAFVARLQKAAVIAPMAIVAVASLPKARADY